MELYFFTFVNTYLDSVAELLSKIYNHVCDATLFSGFPSSIESFESVFWYYFQVHTECRLLRKREFTLYTNFLEMQVYGPYSYIHVQL